MESNVKAVNEPIIRSAEDITSRTQQCLSEMEAHYNLTKSLASMILIVGRSGSGKSSVFQDITSPMGNAQQFTNAATETFQIDKAYIEGREYYVMDTPGLDPQNKQTAFREIIHGIQTTVEFVRFEGILFVTPINQPRVEGFDKQLLRWLHLLCGDDYLPRLTIVTTFWTASTVKHQAALNDQHKLCQQNWQKEFRATQWRLYQHGREYTTRDAGRFLDWFENREEVAQHARDMIARYYGQPETGGCDFTPRIVQELASNSVKDTSAAIFLESNETGSNTQSSRQDEPTPRPQPDNNRRTAAYEDFGRNFQQQELPQETSILPDLLRWAGKGLLWALDNNFGSGSGGSHFTSPRAGGTYNSPFDFNSAVDTMKSLGLDSTREGRLEYARNHGIGGNPFSAEWNIGILKDVRKRHG